MVVVTYWKDCGSGGCDKRIYYIHGSCSEVESLKRYGDSGAGRSGVRSKGSSRNHLLWQQAGGSSASIVVVSVTVWRQLRSDNGGGSCCISHAPVAGGSGGGAAGGGGCSGSGR